MKRKLSDLIAAKAQKQPKLNHSDNSDEDIIDLTSTSVKKTPYKGTLS